MLNSFVTRSGNLASGQVGWPHLASGSVRSGGIANAAAVSGSYASGSIASGHLASGLIANLGGSSLTSGQVGSGFLASGAVQGFFGATQHVASGTLGVFDFGSGAVQSGQVSSGLVTSLSRCLILDLYQAGELLSGSYPVCIGSGNWLLRAMTGSGLRLPAIGVAMGNFNSGSTAIVVTYGPMLLTSGFYASWSGTYGSSGILFLTNSGSISPVVNATNVQVIGYGISGGLFVMPSLVAISGKAIGR